MTDVSDAGMYREQIMDHYKNPRNAGSLKNPSFKHKELNPVCGDEITFTVLIKDGRVADVRFHGKGCAISQASASMLSQTLKGRSLKKIQSLKTEDILEMLGISPGPSRTKCALLCLVALKNGIVRYEGGKV